MSTATIMGYIASLLITYINPEVQDEPGNLGSRVGLVYGSVSLFTILFVFFLVPETGQRSLEELDELFESGVPAWKSSQFKGTGLGARVTQVEKVEKVLDSKAADPEPADPQSKEVPSKVAEL